LGQFAQEVTRVSQEVGTEGKLGGQALVLDVDGTWRELTGVVNKLAANLTSQVSKHVFFCIHVLKDSVGAKYRQSDEGSRFGRFDAAD